MAIIFQNKKETPTMSVKIYNFLNLLFRLVLIYFIIFIWIRYYTQNINYSIWLTALLTFLTEIFIRIITNRKNNKLKLKEEELKKIEVYNNTFTFHDDKFTLNFFYELAKTKHQTTKKKEFVYIEHTNGEKIVLFPYYTLRPFSADDLIFVMNTIKNTEVDKIVLCVSSASKEAVKFASLMQKKILILEKQDVYVKLLKQYQVFPQEKDLFVLKETQKNKIKEVLKMSLSKKRSKGYFVSSLILMLSSLIVPYNIYYLTFSTLLLLLALISFISPLFAKKLPEQVI